MHPNPVVSMLNTEAVSLFKEFKAGDSATSHFTR